MSFTLIKSSSAPLGPVTSDYGTITDCLASPSNTFFAGLNGVLVGTTTGWVQLDPTLLQSDTLAFFHRRRRKR